MLRMETSEKKPKNAVSKTILETDLKFTLGFFTVSSTLKTRQAASVAALIALICNYFPSSQFHKCKRQRKASTFGR